MPDAPSRVTLLALRRQLRRWIEAVTFQGRTVVITRLGRDIAILAPVLAATPAAPEIPLEAHDLLGNSTGKLAGNSVKTPARARRRPSPAAPHRSKSR